MCILSFLSVREFNKAMAKKQTFVTKTKAKLNKKENNFYRMTLTLTLIFIIARISDMLLQTFMISMVWIIDLRTSSEFMIVLNFARQITFLLIYASHSFGFYIYLTRDKNLNRLVKRLLGLKKVNKSFLSILLILS